MKPSDLIFGNMGNSTASAGALDRGALLNVLYAALTTGVLSFIGYLIGWLASADLGTYALYAPIFVAILKTTEQFLRDRSK